MWVFYWLASLGFLASVLISITNLFFSLLCLIMSCVYVVRLEWVRAGNSLRMRAVSSNSNNMMILDPNLVAI
jgi:hypothetical protein